MIVRKAVTNGYADVLRLVKNTGSDSYAHNLLAKKGFFGPLIIEKIDNRAANILKQEALSCGAEAAVNENVSRFKKGFSNAVVFATARQAEILSEKLKKQPFGLKEISDKFKQITKTLNTHKILRYKNSRIDLSQPVVMGIINMDPGSFSGDGLVDADKAAERAVEFERLGAGIIDLGAESSRPGTERIDAKTEIKRLIPALKKIRKAVNIPISIDTYKFETAKAAISEGAGIINDIFALREGKAKLAKLIADTKSAVILMHMKGSPKNMQKAPKYKNCVSEVFEFLETQKEYAQEFGIKEEFIAVDPGIGFGKSVINNIELIKNMNTFCSIGPVVAGVSRKKFISSLSGEDVTSYVAANVLSVCGGADIVRVHDVKETVSALKLIESIRSV